MSSALEPFVVALRDAAMQRVQDEHGVRVEDYLAVLAAATGEAAVVVSGLFDIEHNDLAPGSAVFGDAINAVLTGDVTDAAAIPSTTVVGALRDRLVPSVVPLDAFGSIEGLYRHVAESVGQAPWGDAVVTVPSDHRHGVLPLQVAFELRPAVAGIEAAVDEACQAGEVDRPDGWGRHLLCAGALASALEQTAGAIDPAVGLQLALEITFAMAKTVPMSAEAMARAAEEQGTASDGPA